ncbi:MAG: cell division protein FtsA [Bacteroidales bacterium]|jgi:cell division protein FtsA|nr:cell division protein FtsA [Bacteroidales bacterium]
MENKFITGLDIGTTAIKVFIGKKLENGKIEIIGRGQTESVGVERGEVANPGRTAESIKIAMEQAETMANVKVSEVYVGVAGYHIQSRTVPGSIIRENPNDLITKEEVFKLHDYQRYVVKPDGADIIDIMVQSYAVDREECSDPIGMIGHRLEGTFNIIFGSGTCINKIMKSVDHAGYKLKGLILQPLASAEAVLSEEDKQDGVCLVDIGGGTTDIAIFKQGFLRHIKSIPIAGKLITLDIEDAYRITNKNAESIKINYGTCLPEAIKESDFVVTVPGYRGGAPKEISVKHLASVIKGRVEMILDFIMVELNQKKYTEQLQAIIFTGGGSKIRHIKNLSEFRIPDLVSNVCPINEEHFDNLPEELKNPIYATGLGLLIAAFKEEEEEAERIPVSDKVEDNPSGEKPEEEEAERDTGGNNPPPRKPLGRIIIDWLKGINKIKPFDDTDNNQDVMY